MHHLNLTLCVTLPTLLFTATASGQSPSVRRPNFAWIIADDMSPDTAAYGVAGIATPNLDRLAADGRRYDRAYATAPVCSSSRSALILGCYQTTTGLHPHDVENPQPLPAPYVPLPTLLRQAGWFVTNAAAPEMNPGGSVSRGKTHYNFAHSAATLFDGDDWTQRSPGQPFFAQFQIKQPHRPFAIPESYDETALQAITIPANYPDHPLVRRDWYAYQRSVEIVDQRVGIILDQLQQAGVLDDTVVIFFGDHGRAMPWGKQWLSVEGLQVPLLIMGPGIERGSVEHRLVSLIDLAPSMLALAGLPIPAWMEGRDVLAGEFPARTRIFAARDRCGDAMDRSRAVIAEHHLLVRNDQPELSRLNWSSYKEEAYPGIPLLRTLLTSSQLDPVQSSWLAAPRPETELYDLQADPEGIHNVAADPAYQHIISDLGRQLAVHFEAARDKGLAGDPATEPPLAEIQMRKRQHYNRVWRSRLQEPEPTDADRLRWWLQQYGLDETATNEPRPADGRPDND